MSQTTEFDIVPVSPHVDLVLFDNVISCYPCDRDITVNYTLGENVRPSTWDWVGIFRSNWRYLGEYLSYRWAPSKATHCQAPRRRGLNFPSDYHMIEPDSNKLYQFLYVSHGNHVVGVSPAFRIDLPEHVTCFHIASLFTELTLDSSTESLVDSFEIIDETKAAAQKFASRKRKITNVYKDSCTLVDLAGPHWPAKLGIVEPVVREYLHNEERSLVEYNNVPFKIYDVTQRNLKNATISLQSTSTMRPLIEEIYETPTPAQPMTIEITSPSLDLGTLCYQALTSGVPGRVTRSPATVCPGCQVASALLCDTAAKLHGRDTRIRELESQLEEMRLAQESPFVESGSTATAGVLDWCLQQLQTDNSALRAHVDELDTSLAVEKDRKRRVSAARRQSDANDGWILKEPKRIVRMKKTVGKQSRTLHLIRQTLVSKTTQVKDLQDITSRLRRQIQSEKASCHALGRMVGELNTRIKTILSAKAKNHTNEWRQLARQVHENTQTVTTEATKEVEPGTSSSGSNKKQSLAPRSHVKNKQISKLLKSEKPQRSKLHKERSQAEQCPTCGLRFSVKADRRVIEEHIFFHDRNRNHQ